MRTDRLAETQLVDTRDMIEVHQAFRREFDRAAALVDAVPAGDVKRVEIVATHIELLSSMLHHHHDGEDRLLWPTLLQRATDEIEALVPLMEAQHQAIHQMTEAVAELLPHWRATTGYSDRDKLTAALNNLHHALTEHLDIEEERILPLAARHLSEQEWQRLGEEGLGGLPKKLLPLVFGMLMYQGNPEVITMMLSHAPRLVRLIMPIIGPIAYARYAKRIHGTATP